MKKTLKQRVEELEKIVQKSISDRGLSPTVTPCTPGNCPYAPGQTGAWGMSDEGWEHAREIHEKYHSKHLV